METQQQQLKKVHQKELLGSSNSSDLKQQIDNLRVLGGLCYDLAEAQKTFIEAAAATKIDGLEAAAKQMSESALDTDIDIADFQFFAAAWSGNCLTESQKEVNQLVTPAAETRNSANRESSSKTARDGLVKFLKERSQDAFPETQKTELGKQLDSEIKFFDGPNGWFEGYLVKNLRMFMSAKEDYEDLFPDW